MRAQFVCREEEVFLNCGYRMTLIIANYCFHTQEKRLEFESPGDQGQSSVVLLERDPGSLIVQESYW